MIDTGTVVLLIGLAGTLCGVVFGFAGYQRGRKTDSQQEGRQDGIIMAELGYIKSGIDDVKRKQEMYDSRHTDIIARVVAVEASAKQAHKRLDDYENRKRVTT